MHHKQVHCTCGLPIRWQKIVAAYGRHQTPHRASMALPGVFTPVELDEGRAEVQAGRDTGK